MPKKSCTALQHAAGLVDRYLFGRVQAAGQGHLGHVTIFAPHHHGQGGRASPQRLIKSPENGGSNSAFQAQAAEVNGGLDLLRRTLLDRSAPKPLIQ